MYLAPTYDHASSLGRNESDENRKARLNTRDAGFSVRAYANKCRSCLYAKIGDRKPISPFEAFCDAAKFNPQAAKIWLDSLVTVSAEDTQSLFERIGSDRISSIAINFAQAILEVNKNKLLEFRESLL